MTASTDTKAWPMEDWVRLETGMRSRAMHAASDDVAQDAIARQARRVLKTYSTSFFAVTRFLPPRKRTQVEAVYAAVRYPDEIVDTFPLSSREKMDMLATWRDAYAVGLASRTLRDALEAGVPCFLAYFTRVVREAGIPDVHYDSFLSAMEMDVEPRPFETLDDLIDNYIYGSAIVVGYFLTHIYGPARPRDYDRAIESARNLGIALQLTNFVRDVGEDQRRGRQYLPLDFLAEEGIKKVDARDTYQQTGLQNVVRKVATFASTPSLAAQRDLDAFSPDCRTAIQACIDVYGQLNERIRVSRNGLSHRESVPMSQKFRVLPASKYWRLPLAYMGW
ncbi:MAG: phytoene/squalene synthase family protein [Candidatus Hydrogenedentes bacterium]|nr:phytoene/squalene synthase family protein [Candidatus Hydrogenedentota bacterium]